MIQEQIRICIEPDCCSQRVIKTIDEMDIHNGHKHVKFDYFQQLIQQHNVIQTTIKINDQLKSKLFHLINYFQVQIQTLLGPVYHHDLSALVTMVCQGNIAGIQAEPIGFNYMISKINQENIAGEEEDKWSKVLQLEQNIKRCFKDIDMDEDIKEQAKLSQVQKHEFKRTYRNNLYVNMKTLVEDIKREEKYITHLILDFGNSNVSDITELSRQISQLKQLQSIWINLYKSHVSKHLQQWFSSLDAFLIAIEKEWD